MKADSAVTSLLASPPLPLASPPPPQDGRQRVHAAVAPVCEEHNPSFQMMELRQIGRAPPPSSNSPNLQPPSRPFIPPPQSPGFVVRVRIPHRGAKQWFNAGHAGFRHSIQSSQSRSSHAVIGRIRLACGLESLLDDSEAASLGTNGVG
jgi:hypothetical protein